MIGILITLVLVYLLLLIIQQATSKELEDVDTIVTIDNMPTLKPVPIATVKQKGFLNKLLVLIFNVRRWRLEEAFVYEFDGTRYAISAGFIFDGASIPKILWAIISPVGLLLVPGLIHDYGYRYNGIYTLNEKDEPVWDNSINTQEGWDELFRAIGNEVNQMPFLNAVAEFGLWLGGFKAWNTWRDKKEPQPPYLKTLPNIKNQPPVKQSVEDPLEYESGATKTTIEKKNI